ncbi:MAG: LysM peptidoglycan-binding domain-containing protein [Desulfobacula sp.]|jgi:hypothetical protein|uniref:LysM peptidoglycan-binding domain-containing protein n=1 Tax=Desulfobacula sp. TaxID=2593537 RepID=UPI001D509D63|nr:LysM peptidoglycan-binding domain-containing protein [Desulfobacula sp.]MBT3485155.1 LysM peptidoglycan-binding domain-containing protein [Desulfobacula sp.]MBT3804100.1 LysM peptidoglycan-binding domain-containing protein [Desulfobacula sp.]MBT4025359.1 LysM peptidoglycan-binding domain-containing protein [Desulfobacula sp.]MBT4199489.1 LysM peptidoglycan-binding domain-containing protein [Desulfobacula sp.]
MSGKKTMAALFVLIFWILVFCSTGLAQVETKFIPGENSGFYYTIKKGDTLWNLSEKFYHSQWDWPGLWEMNKDIKNPHWIYPGQKIQVFLKEKTILRPKLANNPESPKKDYPVKVETSFSFSKMDHLGFLKNRAEPSLGQIIKAHDDKLMMSANDIVYIKPSTKDALILGKTYHIFTMETVKKKINHNVFKGVKHIIKAQVKILEHKQNYVIGSITHAYRPVNKDDLIMEYYERVPVLTVKDNPAPIDARLICSEDNHIMINDYVIAFIDAGSARVKPGQIYSILRKNKIKDNNQWSLIKEKTIQLENLESGKLIVLHTEETASTVMILSSKHAIFPNDIIN